MNNTREWYRTNRHLFDYKLLNPCVNCGEKATELHHIIPITKGGTNNDGNIVQLCAKCHGLVHGKKAKSKQSISELTKIGLKRAKLNGKTLGRKAGSKVTTKKYTENKEKIIKLSKSFNGNLSDKDVLELLNIDRGTYYRYKKQIKAELGGN